MLRFIIVLVVMLLLQSAMSFTKLGGIRSTFARAATFLPATSVAGEAGTESFRVFFKDGSSTISPWHDIPLKADGGMYNMVNEIPKYTKVSSMSINLLMLSR